MRRPERLIHWRNSRGRRGIEPESFVSSSCVGDRFQNLELLEFQKASAIQPPAGNDKFEPLPTVPRRPSNMKTV
jgi:hypothetical protein